MPYLSPLRYPGGKNKLSEFFQDIVYSNGLCGGTYIEPYAGGASIAISLLLNNHVDKIIINDVDLAVYSFWYSLINNTENLCKKICDTPVTVKEWDKQKEIQKNKKNVSCLDLGFSTFYLNRTNRSGIINGGIIGGREQNGEWKIDSRYNKKNLIKRIQNIADYGNRISLHNEDSIQFIKNIKKSLSEKSIVYLDPPYYNKGSKLYVNFYKHEDHVKLSLFIKKLKCKWILTYDYTDNILDLYRDVSRKVLTLSYSAAFKMQGIEMLAYSDNLIFPQKKYPNIKNELQ